MDSALENKYFGQIEDMIYTEQKIVTMSSLMKEFKLNSQNAVELLEKFVKNQKNEEGEDIFLTYLISGVLENGGMAFRFANNKELDKKKAEFKNVSQTILYSVHKGNEPNKIALINSTTENNATPTPYTGSVISKRCVKKVYAESKHDVIKPKVVEKTNDVPIKIKEEPKTKATPAHTNSKSQNKKVTNNIANMFSKMPAKAEVKKEPGGSPNKENKNENVVKTAPQPKESAMEIDEDDDAKDFEVSQPTQSSKKSTQSSKSDKDKKKRARKDNSSEQPAKRRKRIINRNDSDSDDIFGGDESEDIVEESDHEATEPVFKPLAEPVTVKNKRRKQVEEVSMEDGYIVTKKVWVMESASEDEEAATPTIKKEEMKKPSPPATKAIKKAESQEDLANGTKGKGKGKKAAPQNQPTLMSFFKKK